MTASGSMTGLESSPVRSTVARYALVAVVLLVATFAAALLEQWAGVGDASSVYLIAVLIAAATLGTWAAVGTSIAAFLIYDYLFTVPRFTFEVSDPVEWVNLVLFLIVAVVIGRLAALLGDRAAEADRRVREGVALVAMSRDVALSVTFEDAASAVAARLVVDAEMRAVWVTDGEPSGETVALAGAEIPGNPGRPWTLMRSTDGETSDWVRVYGDAAPAAVTAPATAAVEPGEEPDHYLVSIDDDEGPVAWIHATRLAGEPRPGRGARRLLVLAADQLSIALRRDELSAGLTEAEVARQSDALRAAILDSVSHDLRTPVASIRALAGGLADAAVEPDGETVRRTAAAIDAEGARLGRLVNGLLDMGRIQAGSLRPDVRPYDIAELVETAVRTHLEEPGAGRPQVLIPDDVPPVLVDAVLFDVVLWNVLDNAATHTPPGTETRLGAAATDGGAVLVTVDDAGPGVPPDAIPHLFDRFYRVRGDQEDARHGIGMGLAIARGFVEAMDGTINAEPSPLGGLRIRIRLPAAPEEQPG